MILNGTRIDHAPPWRLQQVDEQRFLLVLVRAVLELLRDEVGGAADAADGDEDVVREEVHRHPVTDSSRHLGGEAAT